MESTAASASFFPALLVFQCSIRSFTRSACVSLAVASSCVSNPFNCVTEAYETGWPLCEFAAAPVGAGPDWPRAALMHNKKEDRKTDRRKVRFIVWGAGAREQQHTISATPRSSGESPTAPRGAFHPLGGVILTEPFFRWRKDLAQSGNGGCPISRAPFAREMGIFSPPNGRLGFDPYNHHWRRQLQQMIMR